VGEARRKRQAAEFDPEPPTPIRRALRRFRVGWVDWWHDLTGFEQVVLVVTLILFAAGFYIALVLGETLPGDALGF